MQSKYKHVFAEAMILFWGGWGGGGRADLMPRLQLHDGGEEEGDTQGHLPSKGPGNMDALSEDKGLPGNSVPTHQGVSSGRQLKTKASMWLAINPACAGPAAQHSARWIKGHLGRVPINTN